MNTASEGGLPNGVQKMSCTHLKILTAAPEENVAFDLALYHCWRGVSNNVGVTHWGGAQCYSSLQQLSDCGAVISPPSKSAVVGTKSFEEHAGDREKCMLSLPCQSCPSLRRPFGQTRIHSARDAVSPLLQKPVDPPNCGYLGCHLLVPRGLRQKGSEEPDRLELHSLYGVAKHREMVKGNDLSTVNLPIVPKSIRILEKLIQRQLSMRPYGQVHLHHTIGR